LDWGEQLLSDVPIDVDFELASGLQKLIWMVSLSRKTELRNLLITLIRFVADQVRNEIVD
jgi:hypothetical protein